MTEIIARAAPFSGLAGGLLIGLASAIILLGLGKIAGVSGLVWRALDWSSTPHQRALSFAFLAGLPLGALLMSHTVGPIGWRLQIPTGVLIVAGLLVGFGTRMGSGCTSGHGVCGLARLSPRSIAATATFMAAGFAAVAAMKALSLP